MNKLLKPVVVIAALASPLFGPLPAVAQTVAATNPEALALGRSIVATAFPPAARQAMMEKLMATMLDQMKAGMKVDQIKDAGLRQILNDYLSGIPQLLRPTTTAFIPKQMEATAQAYAHMFSLAELKDIAAFAQTPSGQRFLQRSTEIMSDPAVAAVNTEYFSQLQAINARAAPELSQKVAAYLKAHPEAAKSLPTPSEGAK